MMTLAERPCPVRSGEWVHWVVDGVDACPGLADSAKLLYRKIVELDNPTPGSAGGCFASEALLAAKVGHSTYRVGEWLRDLEWFGLVRCVRQGSRRLVHRFPDVPRGVPVEPFPTKYWTRERKHGWVIEFAERLALKLAAQGPRPESWKPWETATYPPDVGTALGDRYPRPVVSLPTPRGKDRHRCPHGVETLPTTGGQSAEGERAPKVAPSDSIQSSASSSAPFLVGSASEGVKNPRETASRTTPQAEPPAQSYQAWKDQRIADMRKAEADYNAKREAKESEG